MKARLPIVVAICVLTVQFSARSDDGFPAWFFSTSEDCTGWESDHVLGAAATYGAPLGGMTAVSESGNALVFKSGRNTGTKGYSVNDICVGNMGEGDYILFRIPVDRLAKGSDVDFMSNFTGRGQGVPKYWLFEYFDGGQWKTADDSCNTVKTLPDGTKYSFYLLDCAGVPYQISTSFASFTLSNAIENDCLLMRIKAVGKVNLGGEAIKHDSTSFICMCPSPIAGAAVQAYDAGEYPAVKDTKKLGILGNSFTFFYGTAMQLKRIARSQGHRLIIRVNHKGGQTFGQHLGLELSRNVWEEGGYDLFLIQDQSNAHAKYADDPVTNAAVAADAKTLSEKIRQYSPGVTIILENTWSYIKPAKQEHYEGLKWMGYGSFEGMDEKLSVGCAMVKDCCPDIAGISPIGKGFAAARALYSDFYKEPDAGKDASRSIYRNNDNSASDHHHNFAGAYIKACVNYLTIYGRTDFDSTVDNCLTDAARAALLRECAKEAVR